MKQIRTTIESPYEPNDNGALWLDTSNPDAPILKAFTNGKWQATIGGEKVTEIGSDSTDEEIPSAKAVNDRITALADEVGVDLDKYKEYFTIEAALDDTTVYFRQSSYAENAGLEPLKVDISTDGGDTWREVTASSQDNGTEIAFLNAGDKVLIRGNNSAYGYFDDEEGEAVENCNFWADDQCYVYGNIMSLVSKDGFEELRSVNKYAFAYFFSNFGEELDMSWMMSKEGTPLLLPATNLASFCYYEMFNACSSLTAAPALPATSLAEACYFAMFQYCTSLTTAPVLLATTLAVSCCCNMFHGCTALTVAPELPATALADWCYSDMFNGCTSLTSVSELPATTLVNHCYSTMFYNCSNLSYIKALFTTTVNSATSSWVQGVNATGTFVKSINATWTTTGVNGVPTGWTVRRQSPSQRNDQADWDETDVNSASYIWNKPEIHILTIDDVCQDVPVAQVLDYLDLDGDRPTIEQLQELNPLNTLVKDHLYHTLSVLGGGNYQLGSNNTFDLVCGYYLAGEFGAMYQIVIDITNNLGSITFYEI